MDIHSDRRFHFDADRDAVWAAFMRTDRYKDWWPWLREFDGTAFRQGDRWRCVVNPPLPYRLRFTVVLTEVVQSSVVSARIDGDITGIAEITTSDTDTGCELRLISDLSAARGPLRLVARLMRPAATYGHDWVLDTGARQFRNFAFDR